ncbi:protein zer-1 homolog [Acanthaster planci]|uniref:Protein zer-1 homolog n=1 Tax=Acanthaster planci TaxID=133434 RepID=A0A8B7XW80_ACAPL|nr:protein zer-1 homolog [Acanthaster planci]XP_022084295.1 protein zer-1 homolog [Acanthaster planci]
MAVSAPPLTVPPRLLDLLVDFCITHVETFCHTSNGSQTPQALHPDVIIPANMADIFLAKVCRRGLASSKLDGFVGVFCNTKQASLQQVDLSRSDISDRAVAHLARHRLLELSLANCAKLTSACLPDLIRQTALRVLDLSGDAPLLASYGLPRFEFPLENLRVLNISFTELSSTQLHCLVKQLVNLVSLDVSGIVRNGDLLFLKPLCGQLRSLVLHDCMLVDSSLDYLCNLTQLRHLDISIVHTQLRVSLTNKYLRRLVKSLQHLVSLDISGNTYENKKTERQRDALHPVPASSSPPSSPPLHPPKKDREIVRDSKGQSEPEQEAAMDEMETSPTGGAAGAAAVLQLPPQQLQQPVEAEGDVVRVRSCIPGLRGLPKPLEFLGVLGLEGLEESEADQLPALRVAGIFTEEHILNSIDVYLKRKPFLLEGLNGYFDLLRAVECLKPSKAVEFILAAMRYHPRDNQIQVSASASLYHLTRGTYSDRLSIHHKQAIITCLLDAIETITDSITLLQNCGLTLFNFRIPEEFTWQFERVVTNLVKLALTEDPRGLLQRIYVHMCNSIVCHVEGEQKLLVGRLGIIKCMLQLIRDRLEKNRCDEVMETAWSTLWNVTDETGDNCEMFLDGSGMELFLKCRETFPNKPELLRNMMGLIGNVAEVPKLRKQLLKYAPVFMELLENFSDGIEVSYNAAGTLSHIAADGPEAWTISHPRRCDVLDLMSNAISSWELNTQRNINYRSFGPILRLLTVFHTPVVQKWAVWALANLCTVSPSKYCKLLEKEDGLKILRELDSDPRTSRSVRELVLVTLRIVDAYLDEPMHHVHVV